jgi:hypothetical protein
MVFVMGSDLVELSLQRPNGTSLAAAAQTPAILISEAVITFPLSGSLN